MIKDHLGNEFENIRDMADYHNVESGPLYTRINVLNWDIEKALKTPIRKPKQINKYIIDNKIIYGEKDLANHLGISDSALYKYFKKGLTVDDIIEHINKNKIIAPNGKVFNNLKELADDYNISYNKLRYRRLIRKLSLEEALSSDYDKKYKKKETGIVDHLGNYFRTLEEAADFHDTTVSRIRSRRSKGLDLSEVFSKNKKSEVFYKGIKYDSLCQLCRELSLPYRSIIWRSQRDGDLIETIRYYDEKRKLIND